MKPNVLIFENSDILRLTLSSIISNLGYEVEAFLKPGACPISYSSIHNWLFENLNPNIIISDVYLPLIFEYKVLGYRIHKAHEL
ncbi:hypothetical protein ACFL2S_01935 [Thermodesulfobacteriota bacterium]